MSETLIKRASKWVGNIPSGWSLTPLKYVCTYNDETLSDNTDPTFEFDYIDISSVNSTDEITSTERLNFADAPSRARRVVRADDIIMSTVRTYLRAVAIIPESKNRLIASTGFLVIRALQESITPEYLGYVIKSDSFISAIEAESVGVSYPAINASEAVKNYIPVPPLDIQRSIVAFLDSRCKPIDEAITRHRLIIDKLEDYRKAVIKNAVTFGLNDEPLKNTGIPWIESVPKTWNVMRVKDIAKLHNGSDPKTEGSVPVYGSGKGSFKSCGEYKEGPTVLLGRKGATLHIPHYIEGKYWNVDTAFDVSMIGNNNLRYFYYLATCFNYDYYRTNTARPSMTQSDYENMKIAVPSYKEQVDIASYLDYKCAAIDEGVARQEQVIAKLEEYRKSLIFHAVTGRIDCTGGAR